MRDAAVLLISLGVFFGLVSGWVQLQMRNERTDTAFAKRFRYPKLSLLAAMASALGPFLAFFVGGILALQLYYQTPAEIDAKKIADAAFFMVAEVALFLVATVARILYNRRP